MPRFGLLGEHLSHSFSPIIHAELGDYEYKLFEKKPEELDMFFKQGDFNGLNVTIPYKKDVIKYCGSLSELAGITGSVNTIIRLADGSLHGDTTDCFGFEYLLKRTKVDLADGKVIVLGSGGSSHTVQTVLKNSGVKEIVVISRSGADNYDNMEKHSDAIVIINTTPVGMYPNNGTSPIADFDTFKSCRAVIDLIYIPPRTELFFQAEKREIPYASGLAMLVAQAKKSAEQFMRTTIADEKIESIASKIAKQTRNIVLIGMPGCGKSSIGAELAKKMGRKFADTDEVVTKTAGKPIPVIFSEDGEDAFRKMENYALNELCKNSGLVIATGGGIVKRPDNNKTIRQNGVVFFLDRDISELPVSGRPLSERDGLAAIAAERLPVYSMWSDYAVTVCGVEQTAADIYNQYHGGAYF